MADDASLQDDDLDLDASSLNADIERALAKDDAVPAALEASDKGDSRKRKRELSATAVEDVEAKRKEKRRTKAIVRKFSPSQASRYKAFLKANFDQKMVKKHIQRVTGSSKKVSPAIPAMMGGITKLFVGDIVEEACCVMNAWGDEGPLRPIHLREAHRRVIANGKVPGYEPPGFGLFRRSI